MKEPYSANNFFRETINIPQTCISTKILGFLIFDPYCRRNRWTDLPPMTTHLADHVADPRQQQNNESLSDILHRFRGVILVILVPLLLIFLVLLLMPSARSPSDEVFPSNRKFLPKYDNSVSSSNSYAVIFDAGSSGSRVHVFCFDQNLDLVHISKELELFVQLKPGLSAHAKDPKAAADSLVPLLEKAESVVPPDVRQNTPVVVEATAGLRQLGVDASERILQEVKDLLKVRSSFKSDNNSVTVLDGTQEGAYEWVPISAPDCNVWHSYIPPKYRYRRTNLS